MTTKQLFSENSVIVTAVIRPSLVTFVFITAGITTVTENFRYRVTLSSPLNDSIECSPFHVNVFLSTVTIASTLSPVGCNPTD